MAGKAAWPNVERTLPLPRRMLSGPWSPERGLPRLVPLGGIRPLDTYTGRPILVGHHLDGSPMMARDCPCRGHIGNGSTFVCLVCDATSPTLEARLLAMFRLAELARNRRTSGPVKFRAKVKARSECQPSAATIVR